MNIELRLTNRLRLPRKAVLAFSFVMIIALSFFGMALMKTDKAYAGIVTDSEINSFCTTWPKGFYTYLYVNNGSNPQTIVISSPSVTEVAITIRAEQWFCAARPSPWTSPLDGSWAVVSSNYRLLDENGRNRLAWAARYSQTNFPRDPVARYTSAGHKEMLTSYISARLNVSGWADRSTHRLCTAWAERSYSTSPYYEEVDPYCITINVRYDWSLVSASSSANVPRAYPGDVVTWSHVLTNNGPGRTWGTISSSIGTSGGFSNPALGNPIFAQSTVTQFAAGAIIRSQPTSYTPNDADIGKTLCQWMNYSPSNSYGGGAASSTPACVNVEAPPPPSADIVINSGPDVAIAVNGTANFSATIRTSNVVNVGSSTFSWRVEGAGPIPSTSKAAVNIDGANPRVTSSTGDIAFNTIGKYCRNVVIDSSDKPAFANVSGDAEQCVEVYKPAENSINVSATDYEKGDSVAPVVTFMLNVTPPCGSGAADVDIKWGGRNNLTGVVYFDETHTVMPNKTYDGSGMMIDGCNPYVRTRTHTLTLAEMSSLNDSPPGPNGGEYVVFMEQPAPESKTIAIKVTEAPFVRFFGSDVLVCNSSSKFVYDNRTAANGGNPLRGSFSQYATFYTANNDPISGTTFLGLRTLTNNTMSAPLRLASNWSGMPCGNLPSPDDFSSLTNTATILPMEGLNAFTSSETYTNAGNIYISGNIERDASVAAFTNIYNHPVVVIRAAGDIYIDPSVSFIEAVLIADGGSVYTCATSTVIKPNSLYDNDCATPLKIRGAVMATNGIYLQRAKGTRYLADTNPLTWRSVVTDPSATVAQKNSTAAEIFEFPDYLNFVRSYNLKPRSIGSYDAYRSLPPRL